MSKFNSHFFEDLVLFLYFVSINVSLSIDFFLQIIFFIFQYLIFFFNKMNFFIVTFEIINE